MSATGDAEEASKASTAYREALSEVTRDPCPYKR